MRLEEGNLASGFSPALGRASQFSREPRRTKGLLDLLQAPESEAGRGQWAYNL